MFPNPKSSNISLIPFARWMLLSSFPSVVKYLYATQRTHLSARLLSPVASVRPCPCDAVSLLWHSLRRRPRALTLDDSPRSASVLLQRHYPHTGNRQRPACHLQATRLRHTACRYETVCWAIHNFRRPCDRIAWGCVAGRSRLQPQRGTHVRFHLNTWQSTLSPPAMTAWNLPQVCLPLLCSHSEAPFHQSCLNRWVILHVLSLWLSSMQPSVFLVSS